MAGTLDTVVIKITGDTKDIDKTITQLQKVGKVEKQNAATFKKTSKEQGKALDFVKGKALALGATLIGAFAIQAAVGSAIKILKEFEKELSTLQSITGSTAKEMEFFSKAAIEVGKATKTGATEVVKAFTLIGSAQPELLKNSKALAEVTKQALILSKAAGIDATEAAKALTGAMNQFGASAEDAAKFTDIFATSQQKGSSFIADTSEALVNAGAKAAAAGLSFETTNAAIQALAKGAITGSRAGTALGGVLSKLSAQSDDKINPSMIGLGETLKELEGRNLNLASATKLVGEEGAAGLLTLIKQIDLFEELDGNLNDVGNAMAQMAINTDNLDGAIEEVGFAWEEFVLALNDGDGFLAQAIRGIVDLGAEFLELFTIMASGEKSFEDLLDDQFKGADASAAHRKGIRGTNDALRANMLALIATKKAQDEENKTKDDSTKKTKKQLTAIELLNKRIGELKKELENQALAGKISEKTLKAYKDAIDLAAEAQVNLQLALADTLPFMDSAALKMEKIADIDMIDPDDISALEKWFQIHSDEIEAAIEAEQTLFRVVTQINTNKLIGIDNEETAALRALESQELGEEALAQKRLDIQTKAAEERAKILTKQAKADKLAAIFQATINTAVAVAKVISNPLLAILVGALGAAEIATIAAQPIPVFHEGKKPELKEGEMFAKILKSESVIPPDASKKYKGPIDAMIDKRFENYVYQEYMLPMIKNMGTKTSEPYNDVNIWSNQKKQIKQSNETNALLRSLNSSMDSGSGRRSWR